MNFPDFVHVAAAVISEADRGASSIVDWSGFDGLVMTVSFNDGTSHRTCGSAVMVAPGIALTATHVINDELRKYKDSDHRIICDALTTTRPYHFFVDQVVEIQNTDLTLLCLSLDNEFEVGCEIKLATLTTRTPMIGEQVVIVGCVAESPVIPVKDNVLDYSAILHISFGRVSENYFTGRDRCMIPWPCVEVDAVSYGGMSGGPVFDYSGRLIGILCSSFSEEGNDGRSYISLLWPCLCSKFIHRWLPHYYSPDRPISLLEIDDELCRIEGRKAVRVEIDEGKNPEWQTCAVKFWSTFEELNR